MTRSLAIILSILLIACSTAMVVQPMLRDQANLDKLFCRTWFGEDTEIINKARELLRRNEPQALTTALNLSRVALLRDSASAYRWRDLGRAFLASGQRDQAILCYLRAIDLAPKSPIILMRAAKFFVSIDQPQQALRYTRQILQLISEYDTYIFEMYGRLKVDPAHVLNLGMPLERR